MFVALIWTNSAAVNVLQSLAFVCLWTAIAMAVLKYRLYEIDRIISRTLAYAIVTGLLVGVYASLVLLATQVFPGPDPRSRWPHPRWPQRRSLIRCGGGCSRWWTGGSTAPGTTPGRPWLASRLA